MAEKIKYSIKKEYLGCAVYTVPPIYSRPEGGVFQLDEKLSQKDLGYLFEVIQHEAVQIAGE